MGSVVQLCVVLFCVTQYCEVLWSTVQCSAIQCCAVWFLVQTWNWAHTLHRLNLSEKTLP